MHVGIIACGITFRQLRIQCHLEIGAKLTGYVLHLYGNTPRSIHRRTKKDIQ